MKKFLKSCLRIIWTTLAIIVTFIVLLKLAAFVYMIREDWMIWLYDINYYLTFCIILSIVYFIMIYKTFKPQKWINRILIFTLVVVGLLLIYAICSFMARLRSNFYDAFLNENRSYIFYLIWIILSIYGIIIIRMHKIEDVKGKKKLKILLGIFLPFLLFIILTWLTKAGSIPNWLDIEILCPNSCLPWYEMVYGHCHKKWWPERWAWGCLNCEYYDAAEECSEYYKMPEVKWYTKENYDLWVKEKHPDNPNGNKTEWTWFKVYHYLGRPEDLSGNPYYDERLDDKFDGYQEALKEYENLQNWCRSYTQVMKPIIYLYPTRETEINVKLWAPENLLHTYPKYNSEKWRNVVAQSNWDLEDLDTWRKLYALYREWKSDNKTNFDEWFVVAWKDIIPFLEEKLAILWLNEREAEEFIVYWLPQMEDNEWNLIRFETIKEQDENMPLNITPTPDTVIRVMMDWKAIDEPIDIPEQHLTTPERNGFTVVEWWGSPRN